MPTAPLERPVRRLSRSLRTTGLAPPAPRSTRTIHINAGMFVALVLGGLVLAVGLVMSAKPDNRLEQNFYGPVHAPVRPA